VGVLGDRPLKAGAQGSRFGILINRLWGLGNQDTPIDVVPEVIPTTDITSNRLEYLMPRGEKPWMRSISIGATVAEYSFVGISNPAGSRRCVVLESARIATANELGQELSTPDTPTAELWSRDGRDALSTQVFALNGSNAALPTSASANLLYFAQGVLVELGIVLPPNSGYKLWENATNTAIGNMALLGYVRDCSPEEMRV